MDRAFQFSLRAALVLCILAGVGLVVYSVVTPAPDRPRVENMPVPPPVVSTVAPTASGTDEGPATGTPATLTAGPGAAQPSAASTGPATSEMSMRDWIYIFTNQQTQRQEGRISGQQAVFRSNNAVDIVRPLVVLASQGDLDVNVGEVHITAQNGNVDKGKDLVRLFTGVKAEGRDFAIRADHVLYGFADRTLTSDGPVEIERDAVAADGTKTPAMTLSGQGIDVDMTLQTMKIRSNAVAHILKVSKDFLAAGADSEPLPLEPTDVTITSDGPMTYQHQARKVTFTKNVKAVYGPRTLTCDELTVQLGEVEGKRDPVVSDIFAVGNVALSFQGQVARGQKLEWHIVTQSATLEGDTCEVTSPEFRIVGQKLVLYRLDSRFDVKGPGTLYWGPAASSDPPQPAEATAPAAPEAPAAAVPVGILTLSKDNNVTVTWQESMSYDVQARYARFDGGVVAQQTGSSLKCDQLKINFRQDSSDIDSVVATGNVSVRDVNATSGRDILCQKLTWDAGSDTVELTAVKGQTVSITQGPLTVSSSNLVLDNTKGALDCPAPGRLDMAPAEAAQPALPVTVQWQQSMHFEQRPLPLATFSGDVLAQRGDESLKAGRLRIEFDAKMDPLKVTAQDDALIEVRSTSALFPAPGAAPAPAAEAEAGAGNRWKLSGGSITIEPPKQVIWSDAPGTLGVLQQGASAGTISWQKQMRLDSTQSQAHFVGGVEGDMPGGALKCEDLTVSFDEKRQLRHARAEGGVQFDETGQNPWKLKSAVADAIFGPGSALRQLIARGDDAHMVEVADQSSTVTSRRLTLSLDTAEGQSQPSISRAVAEEDVTVTYAKEPPIRGTGDTLEWDRSTDTYTLTGEPRARVVRGGLVTSSHKIKLRRPTGEAIGTPGE